MKYYFACPECGKLETTLNSQYPILVMYETTIDEHGKIHSRELAQEAYDDVIITHECGARIEGVVEEDLKIVIDNGKIVEVGGYFEYDKEALQKVAEVNHLEIDLK